MGTPLTLRVDLGLYGRVGIGGTWDGSPGIQGNHLVGGKFVIRPFTHADSITLARHWFGYPEIFIRAGSGGGFGVETGLRYSFFKNVGFEESLDNCVTSNREYGIEAFFHHQTKDQDGKHWNRSPHNTFQLGAFIGRGKVVYSHAENPIAAYLGLDYGTDFQGFHSLQLSLRVKFDMFGSMMGMNAGP